MIEEALAGWPVELHPGLRRLLVYWNDRRGERAYPSRADIDPIALKNLLPHVLLLDACPDEDMARFRLAGEAVNTFYGFNVRGMTWGDVRARILREGGTFKAATVNIQYRRVAEGGVGAYRQGISIRKGASHLYYARILLPLSDDGLHVDAMIGASYSNQDKRNLLGQLPDVEFLFSLDGFAPLDPGPSS